MFSLMLTMNDKCLLVGLNPIPAFLIPLLGSGKMTATVADDKTRRL